LKNLNAGIALATICTLLVVSAVVLSLPASESDWNLRIEHDAYNVSLPPYLQGFGGLVLERGESRLELDPHNASFTRITYQSPNNTSGVVYSENVTRHVGSLINSSLVDDNGTVNYSNVFGLGNNYTTTDLPYRFRLGYAVTDIPETGEGEFFSLTYRVDYSEDLNLSYRDWYDFELYDYDGGEVLAFSVQFRNSTGELVFLLPKLSITGAGGEEHYYGYYYLKDGGEGLLVEAMYFTGFMSATPYVCNLDVTWNTLRIENASGGVIESMRQGDDAYLHTTGGFTGKAGEAHMLGPDGELVHVRYLEDATDELVPLGLSGNFPQGNYTIELRELTYPGNEGRLLCSASLELLYRVMANVSLLDPDGLPRDSYVQGEQVVIEYNTSLTSPLAFIVVLDPSGQEVHRFEINGQQEGSFVYQTSLTGQWGFWTVRIYDARPDFFGEGAITEHVMDTATFYLEPLDRESHAWVEEGLNFTQEDTVKVNYDYYVDLRLPDSPLPTARLLRPDGTLAKEWYLIEYAGELTYYTDRGTPTGEYAVQLLFINSTGEHLQVSTSFELLENITAPPPPPEVPDWGQAGPAVRELRLAVVLVEGPETTHSNGLR